MSIKLLTPYSKYPHNAIITLDAATEAALVANKTATTDLTGGVTWVEPTFPNKYPSGELAPAQIAAGGVAQVAVTAAGVLLDGNGSPVSGGGSASSASANAAIASYTTAVAAAGGSLTAPQSAALLAFVQAAQASGYWRNLNDVMPLCGGFAAAGVKLKSLYGGVAQLKNFVLGDYGALGLTGDGSTKYVDMGLRCSDISVGGLGGLACYLTGYGSAAATTQLMGTSWGAFSTRQGFLWGGSGTPNVTATFDGTTTVSSSNFVNAAPPLGLYHIERGSTSLARFVGNGMPLAADLGGTITPVDNGAQVHLFGGGTSSGSTLLCPASIGFAATTDGGMSPAQCRDFAAHVQALMLALGRASAPNRYVIPVIGQSLARGATSSSVSTSQPYKNTMPPGGQLSNNPANTRPASVYQYAIGLSGPLIESSSETIASGFANTVSQKARENGLGAAWDSHWINVGMGATAYSGIAKGTPAYANSVAMLQVIKAQLTDPLGAAMLVPAIMCVHGEQDFANASYQADIAKWQADYLADISAITGQTTLPVFHSQASSWTKYSLTQAQSPYAVLAAHEVGDGKNILVCPKYFLTYNADGVHLSGGDQYRLLGNYYAKAFYAQVVNGTKWEPLRPGTITRVGAVITIQMIGCVGNLVLDTTAVTDPGNYGFEYAGSPISSVTVSGSVVTVNLMVATAGTLGYAKTGTVGNSAGPTTGARGCLRDSDTTTGEMGVALPNWCVHFSKAVA
jgi:hypothetical protein